MGPQPEILAELVRRVLATVSPLRIILFGSAARDEMGPQSDLDVLVVLADGIDCRSLARKLYRAMRGFACPQDILVVLESGMKEHGHNPYLVIHTAVTEGMELFHASPLEAPKLWPDRGGRRRRTDSRSSIVAGVSRLPIFRTRGSPATREPVRVLRMCSDTTGVSLFSGAGSIHAPGPDLDGCWRGSLWDDGLTNA